MFHIRTHIQTGGGIQMRSKGAEQGGKGREEPQEGEDEGDRGRHGTTSWIWTPMHNEDNTNPDCRVIHGKIGEIWKKQQCSLDLDFHKDC